MTEAARPEDYRLLGIGEDATETEATRAYHRMKALYAEGSLATYALLEDEERAQMQYAIEHAFMRVTMEIRSRSSRAGAPPAAEAGAPAAGEPFAPVAGEEGILSVGALLRHHREKMGFTLKDVSARTRIRTTHLQNIEEENFAELPAPVYLRGFLIEYARTLGLREPGALVARYMQRYSESRR